MKESAYNVCGRDAEGNHYLFNTRRGSAHVMSAGAYDDYCAAMNRAAGPEGASETLRDLIDKGFLVDNNADELSEIISAHQKARQNREGLELLIAPSMACNLDCFYCFESNRYAGRMSATVQSNVVRLVRRYFESGTKRLDVTWYGGEPLLAVCTMERLSKRLLSLCEEFGREYAAEIVTNGTLMDHEKAQQLAAWSVKRAQITLDGVPELHDARRVPKNRKPTFSRILDGIAAAAALMQVTVRVNVCREGAERLEELLQILAARGLNRMVSVYVAPLQKLQDRKTQSPHLLQALEPSVVPRAGGEQLNELDDREAADIEARFVDLLWKYGFPASNRLPEPRYTTCMADKE